jgi:hypothetical protein
LEITLELPEKLLAKLEKLSKAERKTLEELIAESLYEYAELSDPESKAELHAKLCEKYLRESDGFLAKGDHVQASEKAWGAASQMVKAVAAKEGRKLESHRELHEYLVSIIGRTGDAELRKAWSAAGELHRNFYEAWLPSELVKGYVEDVKELINKLRKLL